MKKTIFALLAPGLMALVGSPLHAAIATQLVIMDGAGNSVTVNDDGTSTLVGAVGTASSTGAHKTLSFNGTIGNFTVNITNGEGGLVFGAPELMNVGTTNVLSTGTGTLTIMFTDTGYGTAAGMPTLGPGFELTESATFGASLGVNSSAAYSAFASSTNAIPATTAIGATPIQTFINPGGGASDSSLQTAANPIGSSGSLTEKIVLTFNTAGSIDAGFTISNVPEPASFVFLGSALIGIATLFRKKQQA